MATTPPLSLKECAEELGVHYMTAYRYVRLGMLPATMEGSGWQISRSDLEAFVAERSAPQDASSRKQAPWGDRLEARLRAGDEAGSWQVVQAALSSGLNPAEVYTEMVGPAICSIGAEWDHAAGNIAGEHRATAIATRLVGRLSAHFTTRGRPRAKVVLGTPPGERHSLAVSMVADLLKGAGFGVIDLGSDLPIECFVAALSSEVPVTAIAVSVTNPATAASAADLIAAMREVSDVPVVIGGGGITDSVHAAALGADAWAEDGLAAVAFIESLIA